jgi:hypothetical protein
MQVECVSCEVRIKLKGHVAQAEGLTEELLWLLLLYVI